MESLTSYVLNFKFDFASFRKPYSTTSQASFYLPPLSTLKGMIAAILGIERDKYYEIFNGVFFGIKLNKKPEKFFINTNLLDTSELNYIFKGIIPGRNPTRIEYVNNLDFDLYLILDKENSFISELNKMNIDYEKIFSNSITNFSLYAGRAHALGVYKFIRKAELEKSSINSDTNVRTVVNPEINECMIDDNVDVTIENEVPYGYKLDEENKRALIPKNYTIYFTSPENTLHVTNGLIFKTIDTGEYITVVNKD